MRWACRVSNLSQDWVVLDYTVSSECAAVEGERYNGALVARHADYPRGTELVVCADQRVPNGWRRGAPIEDVAFQSLCQSTLRVRTIAERVMRIYRQDAHQLLGHAVVGAILAGWR